MAKPERRLFPRGRSEPQEQFCVWGNLIFGSLITLTVTVRKRRAVVLSHNLSATEIPRMCMASFNDMRTASMSTRREFMFGSPSTRQSR